MAISKDQGEGKSQRSRAMRSRDALSHEEVAEVRGNGPTVGSASALVGVHGFVDAIVLSLEVRGVFQTSGSGIGG